MTAKRPALGRIRRPYAWLCPQCDSYGTSVHRVGNCPHCVLAGDVPAPVLLIEQEMNGA